MTFASGRLRALRHAGACSLLIGAFASASLASAQTPLTLSSDTQFPFIGGTIRLDLDGAPDAHFQLKMSQGAREADSIFGTIFLDLATLFDVRKGTLDANGHFSVTLKVPRDPTLVGTLFFFEGATTDLGNRAASNALAVRIESAAPTGPRKPVSIAVAPDGSRAFVLNQADASVSVIDPTTDSVLRVMPVSAVPATVERMPRIAIDPEGRHVFVVNPALPVMTVIHAATDSISAMVPVPRASRSVAFRFDGTTKRVFVASERDQALLVFEEAPHGIFTQVGTLPLQGRGPAPLATLPDGRLLVGQQTSLELEVVDPDDVDADGDPLVARVALGSRPIAFSILGTRVFVSTFTPSTDIGPDGVNEVLEYDSTDWSFVARWFGDVGTDYFASAVTDARLVVVGAASGSLVVADPADLTFAGAVDLLPAETVKSVPGDVALVPTLGSGAPQRVYVLDRFRETVMPVHLASDPPFALDPEIALARSGAPVLPFADLDAVGRGEYLFSSVAFFNGTPNNPNPVSCSTCHQDNFSDSITTSRGRNAPGLFSLDNTAPYGWNGDFPNLVIFPQLGFDRHARVGGDLDPQFSSDLTAFLKSIKQSPPSPFRNDDGTMTEAALRGELVFNGAGNCAQCHAAPGFIPQPPDDPNVDAGVGTDFTPVNVPTLLGLWATAPYFHDGSAATLRDVIDRDTGDLHGTTSLLDEQQRSDLVEFLKSL